MVFWPASRRGIGASGAPARCCGLALLVVVAASWPSLVAASPAVAAGWSAEPVPTQIIPEPGVSNGVACSSADQCLSVGYETSAAGETVALAESWNGTAWSIVATPTPPGSTGSQLSAISCVSASACTAVGSFWNSSGAQLPFAEAWNGSAWSLQSVPAPAGVAASQLAGVSCTSTSNCQAVGGAGNAGLAERWDGTQWTVESASSASPFTAVSCSSPNACMAVGGLPGEGAPFAERWNGSAWSPEVLATPSGGSIDEIEGVSCPSDNGCVAVGTEAESDANSDLVPFAEQWNGSTWAVSLISNTLGPPTPYRVLEYLDAVSCSSATACTAVGSNAGGQVAPVVAQWNGLFWTVTSFNGPNPSLPAPLAGVSCSGPSACVAVGDGVAESWAGSGWTPLDVPSPPAAVPGFNNGSVACAAPGSCVAVGYYEVPGANTPELTATHLQGTTWTLDSPPLPSGVSESQLLSASCATPTFCLAVGEYTLAADNTQHPLVELWNGTAWTLQTPVDPPESPATDLEGVSCATPMFCVAVGVTSGDYDGDAGALAEVWNGSSWATVPTPIPAGSLDASLQWVSCSSAAACTIDGSYSPASVQTAPYAVRWNGSTLTLQAGAPGGPISCPTDDYCVATPQYGDTASVWSDGAWGTPQTLPDLPDGVPQDYGVSCSSPSACTVIAFAYGSALDADGELPSSTGAERWNGASWSEQPTAIPPQGGSFLSAVSCPTDTDCTAIGTASGTNLAEQYDAGGCTQPPAITAQPSSVTVDQRPAGHRVRGGLHSGRVRRADGPVGGLQRRWRHIHRRARSDLALAHRHAARLGLGRPVPRRVRQRGRLHHHRRGHGDDRHAASASTPGSLRTGAAVHPRADRAVAPALTGLVYCSWTLGRHRRCDDRSELML